MNADWERRARNLHARFQGRVELGAVRAELARANGHAGRAAVELRLQIPGKHTAPRTRGVAGGCQPGHRDAAFMHADSDSASGSDSDSSADSGRRGRRRLPREARTAVARPALHAPSVGTQPQPPEDWETRVQSLLKRFEGRGEPFYPQNTM